MIVRRRIIHITVHVVFLYCSELIQRPYTCLTTRSYFTRSFIFHRASKRLSRVLIGVTVKTGTAVSKYPVISKIT
jgi:hypothetical protein